MLMVELFVAISIQAEIIRLGHDDWAQREAAQQRLEAWGPLAWRQLHQVNGCPERMARCRRLMDQAAATIERQALERLLAMRIDGHPLPWADCLGLPSDEVRELVAVADYHPLNVKLPGRRYEQYRLATALWLLDLERNGEPCPHDRLRDAVRKERAWIRESFKHVTDLIELVATIEP